MSRFLRQKAVLHPLSLPICSLCTGSAGSLPPSLLTPLPVSSLVLALCFVFCLFVSLFLSSFFLFFVFFFALSPTSDCVEEAFQCWVTCDGIASPPREGRGRELGGWGSRLVQRIHSGQTDDACTVLAIILLRKLQINVGIYT